MLMRFIAYGALGWCLEVIFTGVWNVVRNRDRYATAQTYLWMLPIYGAGGCLLETAHHALVGAQVAWWLRGFAYLGIIYSLEFVSGTVLKRALGKCPWDYSMSRFHVKGLVRLDYAPAWFLCGLGFERVKDVLDVMQKTFGST
jgi:uncharacterized membrane protein